MRRITTALLRVAAAASIGFCAPAGAASATPLSASAHTLLEAVQSDDTRRTQLLRTGQRVAEFCGNCHGRNGTSTTPEVPNLAGQNAAYVLEQMRKFAAGERRDDMNFMRGLIKALNEEEKAAVAYYYAGLEPVPVRVPDGVGNDRGRALFASRCAQCHGERARGAQQVPRLAGQQPEYLRLSLERYQRRTGERIYPPMSEIVRGLGAADVMALVDYLAALR